MKRRMKIVGPVLAVVVAMGLWLGLRDGEAGPEPLVASGTVEATEADLGFQAPGRIARVEVREGDPVTVGQEIAALEARELRAGRDGAQGAVEAAEARLRELRSGSRSADVERTRAALNAAARQAEEARREAERAGRLFQGGAISRQALDRAETQAAVAQAQRRQAEEALGLVQEGPRTETIEAQEAMVAQARAALDRTEASLENAVITAPFAGVVTLRHREPGETVAPGAPVLTLLDRDDRWVRIYVPEDQIGRVQIGQAAAIRSDTYPDRTYEGRVVFIGSEAEFTPRNVQTPEERTRLVYPVKVRITGDPGFELKPGIPADVRLEETGEDAPEAPGEDGPDAPGEDNPDAPGEDGAP